ncbi:hypothetical protein H6786_00460 [Candidatus Nomurabacteria bacterium]|nr:hypothetical protein [Candidatus Nomurabacteria bacterium]
MEYLKPKHYYTDLYDKHTVERCRRIESTNSMPDADRPKKVSKKEAEAINDWAHNLILTFEKGSRWSNKEKTINDWMERDRRRDELLESAKAPEDIRCLTCRNRMEPNHRQLWHGDEDKPDRVLFMYDCPNQCLPRRAFFDDGKEWRSTPHLCARCGNPTNHTVSDDKEKMVTTYTCPTCHHVEVDEYVWNKPEDEYDEHFATDRDRFCVSDEEGRNIEDMKWQMERMGDFAKEWEEKEKARAKKLEENPKGFHLEGAGYTCSICRNSTPAGDNWYDKWGIKCLVCQWSIDHKEIPASLAKNEDSWYRKYDFEHYFNVKGQTLNKWVREGLVKARTVSRYGEGVHTQVFLVKDNKDFLPPKKLLESKRGRVVENGKEEVRILPWYCFGDPHEILKGYKIMDYLRVLSPEEVEQREKERQEKAEKRRLHREKVKAAREKRKKRK